jgi:hypothetical protein
VADLERLLNEGATDFERQLLSSVQAERPSPQLELRMRQALGLPGVATPPATSPTPSLAFKLGMGALAAGGLLALGLFLHARPGVSDTQTSRPVARTPQLEAAPGASASPLAERVPRAVVNGLPSSTPAPPTTPALAGASDGATLREEIALLDVVRDAAASGDERGALEALERFDRRFPHAVLRHEADILRGRLGAAEPPSRPSRSGSAIPGEAASRR